MKTFYILIFSLFIFQITFSQVDPKNSMADDFEKFKQGYNQGFEKFKKQREEELKKMEQEYQDYYNSMVGLKDYYVKKKDTTKANVVTEIISYEESIRKALGKEIKASAQPGEQSQQSSPQQTYPQNNQQTQPQYTPPQQNQPAKQPEQQPQQNQAPAQEQPVQTHEQPAQAQSSPEQAQTTFQPGPDAGTGIPAIFPLPKPKARITSKFGMRNHPVLGRPIKHNGVDFGSGRDTEIYSAADGKVILSKLGKGYGNYIIIEHNDGISTVYAHLNARNVEVGDRVSRGQLIGLSGSTGRSTGPHLHYEIRVSATPVDPEGYLKD